MEAYDIVICGGGPVGTSLALSLAHLPLTICLIDPVAAPPPRHKDDRTFTLAQGSKRALASLGVWPLLPKNSFHPITEIEVSDRSGGFGLTHIRAHELGLDALGFVTENAALLAALYGALKETSVVVRPGRFASLEGGADATVVTLSGAQGTERLSGRLLVGADGTDSAVRAALGIPVSRRAYGREALVVNCQVSAPKPRTAFERFTPEGPLAALPLDDDRYTFVMSSAHAQDWQELPEPQFLARFEKAFGPRLGHFRACGRRLRFPLILQKARYPAAARAVLVGNAAHTLHPVAGQGFNLGLRDVAALADSIAEAWRRHEDFGSRSCLDRYLAGRARDTASTIGFTDGLVRIFSNKIGPLVAARNLALTLVDCLPVVKRALAVRTMGLKGPLPNLLRGLRP